MDQALSASWQSDLAAIGRIGAAAAAFLSLLSVIFLLAGILWLVVHLFCSYPVYRLAKKAGREHAWLAFIPIARYYTLASIGEGPVRIPFIKKELRSRAAAFWAYLLFPAVCTAVTVFCLLLAVPFFLIPVAGWLIGALLLLLAAVLSFLASFGAALLLYTFYYDIFTLYRPENRNNDTLAVVCAACTYLGLSPVCFVLLYTLLNRDPHFTGDGAPEAEESAVTETEPKASVAPQEADETEPGPQA